MPKDGAVPPALYSFLKRLDAHHDAALRHEALTYPLRLGSFAAYRGLELVLGERHPHERTIAQARAIEAESAGLAAAVSELPPRTRALFFSPRGWYAHTTFEAVLAKALQRRGARPEFVLCDGGLRQCDFKPASDPIVTRPLCWRCQGFPRRLLGAFALPTRELGALLEPGARERARALVAGRSVDELLALRYRELPIGAWCVPSAIRLLLHTDLHGSELAAETLRGLCESAILTAEVAHVLVGERPDVIFLCNGLFYGERVVAELARAAGIAVVSYEVGWIPGTYLLVDSSHPSEGHTGMAIDFPMQQAWSAVSTRPLDESQRSRIVDYLGERRHGRGGLQDYWPRMESDRAAVEARLQLRADQRLAVAFTNIVWDTAVHDHHKGYASMFDWLADTIRAFATRPDWHLVVRTHPAETRLIMQETRDRVVDRIAREFPTLPPNVTVVAPEDPLSSYVLADRCDVVLVYTSSVGFESACLGRPVVVAGDVHYAEKGFTFDVARRDDYMSTVERASSQAKIAPEAVDLALRYAHMFFFEYMKSFPFVSAASRATRSLTFSSLSELDPGRHRHLDEMCDGILRGAPFVR